MWSIQPCQDGLCIDGNCFLPILNAITMASSHLIQKKTELHSERLWFLDNTKSSFKYSIKVIHYFLKYLFPQINSLCTYYFNVEIAKLV